MFFTPVSLAEQERRIDAILLHGSLNKASIALGIPRSTLRYFIRKSSIKKIIAERQQQIKSPPKLENTPIKILVIGDAHDSPHLPDKSRFYWIGRHAREIGATHLVSIGDFLSLDSLCRYVDDATYSGRLKGTIQQEFDSGNLALDEIERGLGDYKIFKHICFGNHEWRIDSYSERNPAIYGMLMMQLEDMFKHRGWTYSSFKAYHNIGGVLLTHVPHSKMGKPFGANEITIANQITNDLIFGHTHLERVIRIGKIGTNIPLTIANVGSSLPHGYVEPYARHSMTGWTYGVSEFTIADGRIRDHAFVSMLRLQEMYG